MKPQILSKKKNLLPALVPELKQRRDGDIALYSKKQLPTTATTPVTKKEKAPEKKDEKLATETAGGPLVFGNYNCHYQQYQGAGALVAYKSIPQGYFRLNANGTYRWLDNGGHYAQDPFVMLSMVARILGP